MPKILIVDDEAYIRRSLSEILLTEKYNVDTAEDGKSCLAAVEKCKYDVILLDIKMPEPDGLEVLAILTENHADTPVIMISGHGNLETAVDAVKKGAFDYIAKPPDLNRLLIVIKNALDKRQMTQDLKRIRSNQSSQIPEMIGQSPQIRFLKSQLKRTADADARVMITGPNGSGKELVARSLHYKSARSEGPLVSVNCAAIPGDLIESILFGHEKGAYTGAYQASAGKFEKAHGGTIFLDEIGDMSLQAQAKVLRALEENKITRVGGQKEIPIDVRVISATNRDLFQMIAEKTFREDLYYRLAVVNLHVPPLNHRREDIPLLVNHFIHTFCTERGKPIREVTPEAMKALQEFDYRGNIRELRNIIERVLVLGSLEINADDIDNLVLSQVNPLRLHVQQLIYQLGGVEQLVTYIEKEFMKPTGQ